jgi:transposase-like protein
MNEVGLLQSLSQVPASETEQVFRDFLRGQVREMICEVMAAEVTELCGPKHAPSGSTHYRAGTSPGRVLYEGEREKVLRSRVRCKSDDGTSQEVDLASYRIAKNPEQFRSQIVQAIVSGVSTRGVEAIKPDSPEVKRSNVSRLWQEAGSKFIEQLRGKDLASTTSKRSGSCGSGRIFWRATGVSPADQ